MRVLLLGEYSNVHWTLAEGLRSLGHDVVVASDGDSWKGYRRDVDLSRRSPSASAALAYVWRLLRAFPRFQGFDVVQLINPVFLSLKAERIYPFFHFLRRRNRSVFLGAYGMDHYWVRAGMDCRTFRYSDFNLGPALRRNEDNAIWERDWLRGPKGRLNRRVARACDGIAAGLYEYYAAYRPDFAAKLRFIPFPIRTDRARFIERGHGPKLRFFIGIQRSRSVYKGTDVMLRALQKTVERYPDACEMVCVESVPFDEYVRLLDGSDVLLDQLYSYTPAMNALEAMAHGLVVVGGGEPENYELLGEQTLRPIVNVRPTEDDVCRQLAWLVEHRDQVPRLSRESRLYVERHHDYRLVARAYLDFWRAFGRD